MHRASRHPRGRAPCLSACMCPNPKAMRRGGTAEATSGRFLA
jgi:hypothetical protein